MTENIKKDKQNKLVGRIIAVSGPVVDVEFSSENEESVNLPGIYNTLVVEIRLKDESAFAKASADKKIFRKIFL